MIRVTEVIKNMKEAARKKISWAVLAVGICFIVFGAYREEVATVLNKAIRICLECVGIG